MYTRRYLPQQRTYAPSYTQPRHHHPLDAYYVDSPQYYAPSSRPSYDDYYTYEQPSEFDELAYEEERLIEAQRQIDAQRRRIAEERRRVAREAEYKRLQEMRIQQEAERRAELMYQQRIAQQQQQAALQHRRQAAALREAQLEAALQEIELQDVNERRHVPERRYVPERRQIARESQNPLELLLGLIAPPSQTESTQPSHCLKRCDRRQQQKQAPRCQQKVRGDLPFQLTFAIPSSSNASQSPSTATTKSDAAPKSTTTPTPKSSAAPAQPKVSSLLSSLRTRIDAAAQSVASLLTSALESLNLKQFTTVDQELMNILLALDNVNAHSEEAREARKSLVKETVKLLERVDQRKDEYTSSSSESSSNHNSDSEDSDVEAEAEETVEKKQPFLEESEDELEKVEDEEVGEIDADSEGSDVEDDSPSAEPTTESNDASANVDATLPSEKEPVATESTQVENSATEASAEVEPNAQVEEVAEDFSNLIDFADSFADTDAPKETQSEEQQTSEQQVEDEDVSGLGALKNLSNTPSNASSNDFNPEYHVGIPIKSRNVPKSSVTIEAVPSA